MRRVMVASATGVLLVAAGGYAAADVYDVVPGVLTRDTAAPAPTATPTGSPPPWALPASADPGDLLTSDGADAPVPTADGLAEAVASASDDPALERDLGVSIRDGVTGEQLYGLDADIPRVPASTAKLLAATAVADTLDLDARIPTTVLVAPGARDLVLVVAGDTLLDPGAGDEDAVAGRAGLADLAAQVADALGERTDVRLRLDLSFAPGPLVPPTWNPNDVRDGFAGPVAMTGLATQRAAVGDPAAADPPAEVARAFVARLADEGVTARLRFRDTWTRPAPDAATEVGRVESATVAALLDRALDLSDNALTESLVRRAAATAGRDTSDPRSTPRFVRDRLEADAVPVDGMVLHDASGLSPDQAVSPATLSAVLVRAVTGESDPLRLVIADLPVSGLTGTLAGRFEDDEDVLGVPRAKTGTLRAGSSLAGTTVTTDGRPLVVVVQSEGFPRTFEGTARAREALDAVVAAVTRCGCR
ncbi:D-alanyl-D-alanine carboxypeptidase [Phycicoccus sp. BSK3Z-2]|uniref:D-alanyl-D-alanine carboxypeptidase n=1 Tax=Phycicoccus avicenniae TaxID=2828860 RepID=A0A941I0L4_9MICO|nr:D-alanyl-D-alanine carboxypeptidase [Phycicoccus avicenniae]MBR7743346.1 D-alanyl-D-alanine carboxypeptidase [Phycicoccus avicenniae]